MRTLSLFLCGCLLASLAADEPGEENVRLAIRRLRSRDSVTREAARSELAGLQASYRPMIEQALNGELDPDVRTQLRELLKLIGRARWRTDLDAALREAAKLGKPVLVLSAAGALDGYL